MIIFVDAMIFRYASGVKVQLVAERGPGTITSKNGSVRTAELVVTKHKVTEPSPPDAIKNEVEALQKLVSGSANLEFVYSHEIDFELLFQPEVDILPGRLMGCRPSLIGSHLFPMAPNAESSSDRPKFSLTNPAQLYHVGKSALAQYPERWKGIFQELLNKIPSGDLGMKLEFRQLLAEFRDLGHEFNAATLLLDKLEEIDDDRFSELLRLAIKKQMTPAKYANTYLDSYHMWTAQLAGASYFLTMDNAILQNFRKETPTPIEPSELALRLNL